MENQVILIIDVRAIAHYVKHGLGKNKTHLSKNDKPTFILHGFLIKLLEVAERSRPDTVVFALDSKISVRKKIFPAYKKRNKDKTKTKEEKELDELAYPQFIELENTIIPNLGFKNVYRQEGYEADDIIARIAKKYGKSNHVVIATSDQDLYQCLRPNISMYNIKRNAFYTIKDFQKEWGIHPEQWVKVKTIAGCKSDEVPGVYGVAEKTAIKYIKGQMNEGTKTYKNIVAFPYMKRNKKLVKLPFKKTNKIRLKKDHLSLKHLKRICNTYGFKVLWGRRNLWKRFLNFR